MSLSMTKAEREAFLADLHVAVVGISKAGGALLALCAQVETPPFKYVTVEGVVTALDPVDVERDLVPISKRYLGPEQGAAYAKQLAAEITDSVLARVRPERWRTVDYAKER